MIFATDTRIFGQSPCDAYLFKGGKDSHAIGIVALPGHFPLALSDTNAPGLDLTSASEVRTAPGHYIIPSFLPIFEGLRARGRRTPLLFNRRPKGSEASRSQELFGAGASGPLAGGKTPSESANRGPKVPNYFLLGGRNLLASGSVILFCGHPSSKFPHLGREEIRVSCNGPSVAHLARPLSVKGDAFERGRERLPENLGWKPAQTLVLAHRAIGIFSCKTHFSISACGHFI